jgi:coenzyme F420 biosynthesis associated uncharacterized protein
MGSDPEAGLRNQPPVDWALAQRVANRVAGSNEFARSYHHDSLGPDFAEFTAQAEELVAAETGLRSLSGAARARVVTRGEWVGVNLASFQRLLRPLLEKMSVEMQGPLAQPARAFAGAEIGTLLGWMSSRVLGQYDVMVADDNPDDGDVVYYVGSNVLAVEKRHGFPPREFRLWLALHEVTHRAQFTGVPWMREYYVSLVKGTMGSMEPNPKRFMEALKRALADVRAGHNPLVDAGIVGLIAGNEQRVAMDKIAGLMSLLEGHGDTTMARAGKGAIPSADRFAKVLNDRRGEVKGVARAVRVALGVEAKMRQYAEGERFIEAVEAARGPSFLDRAWTSAEALPKLQEIRDPERWVSRVSELPAPVLVRT